MSQPETLVDLLSSGADTSVALVAPDRAAITHSALRDQIAALVSNLADVGVERTDRVALVMPNGPALLTAFLAVAETCAAAPMNPALTESELRRSLIDLDAIAVITTAEAHARVRQACVGLEVSVLECMTYDDGSLVLSGTGAARRHRKTSETRGPAPDAVALILHTSGTTARPKRVPLSHRNLCLGAASVAVSLRLGPLDRCLGIMPLFHIHGLVASVLASLATGGSVACTPGFDGHRFFHWVQTLRPTWYTGVPTMHQVIARRAAAHAKLLAERPLRLIRSSSAPLPPIVADELELAFGAPVIESYGMTEAAHQIASNPLPPQPRKSGTVGPSAGAEIRILDRNGDVSVEPGLNGPVVIRGPALTAGYEAAPAANRESFRDGWFRTGDEGRLDAEGYLTLTGRLKEIINRGGEKISPREVDEALLSHPEVHQAVAFPVPHPLLGEDVAAAVVIHSESQLTVSELRKFAGQRLAPFKVPKRIIMVDEIPTGPSGKLSRMDLTERFGIDSD